MLRSPSTVQHDCIIAVGRTMMEETLVIQGRGSAVRADKELSSAMVGTLARGDVVTAAKRDSTQDGKARIYVTSPLVGWISASTAAPAPASAAQVDATKARVAKAAEAEAARDDAARRKAEAKASLGAAASGIVDDLKARADGAASDEELRAVAAAVASGALTAAEADALGRRAAEAAGRRAFEDRGAGAFFSEARAFDAFGQRFRLYGYESGGAVAWDRGLIRPAPGDAPPATTTERTVFFVHPLAERIRGEASYAYLEGGARLLPAFYGLRRSGFDVALVAAPEAGRANVAAFRGDLDLGRLKRSSARAFDAVDDEAQRRRVDAAGLEVLASGDEDLPPFAAPGSRPRDEARGDSVDRVACVGPRAAPLGAEDALRRGLEALGVDLVVLDLGDADQWAAAYETADLALHLGADEDSPPTPLVDAWRAGVPALLSDAPAFAKLRDSPLDYFEVDDADDVLDAVAALKSDPGLFKAMRARCATRAADYADAACAARWAHVLDCPKRA